MLRIIVFGTFSETFLKQNKILQKKKKEKEKIKRKNKKNRRGSSRRRAELHWRRRLQGRCEGRWRRGRLRRQRHCAAAARGILARGEGGSCAGVEKEAAAAHGQLVQKRRKDQDLA